MCFHLGWMQHGGSGLGRGLHDILEMPLDHIIRDVKRVSERRKFEYEAMRKK